MAPNKNYTAVADAFQRLGAAGRPNRSYWFVDSAYTAERAAQAVWAVMDLNDKLMVAATKTNKAYRYNIDLQVSQFMQTHWNH